MANSPPAVCTAVSPTKRPVARSVWPPLVRVRSSVSSATVAPASDAVSTRCTSWAATSAVVCIVKAPKVEVNAEVRSSRVRPSVRKPASDSVAASEPAGPPNV